MAHMNDLVLRPIFVGRLEAELSFHTRPIQLTNEGPVTVQIKTSSHDVVTGDCPRPIVKQTICTTRVMAWLPVQINRFRASSSKCPRFSIARAGLADARRLDSGKAPYPQEATADAVGIKS